MRKPAFIFPAFLTLIMSLAVMAQNAPAGQPQVSPAPQPQPSASPAAPAQPGASPQLRASPKPTPNVRVEIEEMPQQDHKLTPEEAKDLLASVDEVLQFVSED